MNIFDGDKDNVTIKLMGAQRNIYTINVFS